MQAALGTMDYIIDTVSGFHPLGPLLGLLKVNGKLVTVGLPATPLELPILPLALGKPQLLTNATLFFVSIDYFEPYLIK